MKIKYQGEIFFLIGFLNLFKTTTFPLYAKSLSSLKSRQPKSKGVLEREFAN